MDQFTEPIIEPITSHSLGEWNGREWKRNGREERVAPFAESSSSVTRAAHDDSATADAARGPR